MNRKQLYNEITSLNLQEEVKATYGKNYTNCSTEQLKAVVDNAHETMDAVAPSANSFIKLIEILAKKKILLKSEIDAINKA